MPELVILFVHALATLARLLGPGGIRSVLAESVLVKQQLLILHRSRQRSPNLCTSDRLVAGLCSLLIRPARLIRSAIVLRPFTLLSLHQALRNRKYRLLFSSQRRGRPGPKGPNKELLEAVVQMKQRNPTWGCPRIAQQMALAFDIPIDKDVVRRILARHYRPQQDSGGRSWLTFMGHLKASPWSLDMFRCESATLRTHWVLVVMDQYTRRIIGFGVHAGAVDGVALCRMFNHAVRWQRRMSKYLSSDHDPLYRFERWQANLRILEVTEIKTVPYVPWSHPFVERLIGTFDGSTWIARYSGPRRISKTSCSISGHTSTIIARMPHGQGGHRTMHRPGRSRTSNLIAGNLTVEDCIKHPWRPDSRGT